MPESLHDIQTRDDCEKLVRSFYGRALTDPVIGWLFTDVAKLDLEEHVPRITMFWETMLLGARSYGGGAFRPHLELNLQTPLKNGHFQRWLYLWRETVHELFSGPVADEAIHHAERVAAAFSGRLEAINGQVPDRIGHGHGSGAAAAPSFAPPASSPAPPAPAELPVIHHYRAPTED